MSIITMLIIFMIMIIMTTIMIIVIMIMMMMMCSYSYPYSLFCLGGGTIVSTNYVDLLTGLEDHFLLVSDLRGLEKF